MITLGKVVTFSMLGFGTFAWGGGDVNWQQPHHTGQTKQNHQAVHNSKHTNQEQKKHTFYKLSQEERKRLCNDDTYWQAWSWYYGNNKHDYCQEFAKHLSKQHTPQTLASQPPDQSVVNYATETEQPSQPGTTASIGVEQQATIALEAAVDQRTVINNYTYVIGDNNTVNNAITVNNNATIEQQASIAQTAAVTVEQTAVSAPAAYNQSHQGQAPSEHPTHQSQQGYEAEQRTDCKPCDNPCNSCIDDCDDWQQNACDSQQQADDCYGYI